MSSPARGRVPLLAMTERKRLMREPQVALDLRTGLANEPDRRIRRHILRPKSSFAASSVLILKTIHNPRTTIEEVNRIPNLTAA